MKTEIVFIDEDTITPEEVEAEEKFENSKAFSEAFQGGEYIGQAEE